METDSVPIICDKCATVLQAGRCEFYVIRIEAIADPTPPVITEEDLARDTAAEIDRLARAMHDLSEQEAMDQVYRKVTLNLCNACYRVWIEDPTGS